MFSKKRRALLLPCAFLIASALFVFLPPHATHALEVTYPHIPGFGGQNDTLNSLFEKGNMNLGDLFQFIFVVAIWLVGLLAFGSLLVFGFIWETSVANPSKKLAAKMHFQGTLVGVAILLGFTIILRTINPDLAILANRTFNFCGASGCSSIRVAGPTTSASLTYTIDFKNTSVKPSVAETYTKAFEDVPIFQNSLPSCYNSPGCDTANPDPFTKEFFQTNVVDKVVSPAISNGINPVFATAVWLVGTKMTQGKNPFGCTGSLGNPPGAYSNNVYDPNQQPMPFQDSENCFFAYVKQYGQDSNATGFERWISNYCRASVSKTLCGNPAYASFIRDLQENYDAFFKVTDTTQPSQPLNPPLDQPVK